mmetsp:Transcript_1581/g.5574  ORF Transcript_1581/g.5574 Transcript_1581/m.5574 type:complete len:214 (-) Transcript_1581:662-1303(-)
MVTGPAMPWLAAPDAKSWWMVGERLERSWRSAWSCCWRWSECCWMRSCMWRSRLRSCFWASSRVTRTASSTSLSRFFCCSRSRVQCSSTACMRSQIAWHCSRNTCTPSFRSPCSSAVRLLTFSTWMSCLPRSVSVTAYERLALPSSASFVSMACFSVFMLLRSCCTSPSSLEIIWLCSCAVLSSAWQCCRKLFAARCSWESSDSTIATFDRMS